MPSKGGGGKTWIERLLKLIPHVLTALSLAFSFCLGVNELRINHYETVRRLSVQNIVEYTLVSRELDGYVNLLLIMVLTILTILELSRGWETRGFKALLNPVLASASILSFLAGLRIVSFILLASAYTTRLFLRRGLAGFLNVYACILMVAEALSLLRWAAYPLFHTQAYTDTTWFLPRLDSLAFYTFDTLLGSLAILMFLFSFPLAILPFARRVELKEGSIRLELRRVEKKAGEDCFHSRLLDSRVILASCIFLLLYLSYLPYSPPLNPSGKPASVDLVFYEEYLDTLKKLGLTGGGAGYLLVEHGERATAIFLTYLVSLIPFLSSVEAVKASLFTASCMLVFASHFSVKKASGSMRLAAFSAFTSVFSVQTVVGLYAGYLANMVATPLLLLMTLSLSKAVGEGKGFLLLSIFFSALALYSHPWSWTIFILAILMLVPLNLMLSAIGLRSRYGRKEVSTILLLILVSLTMDLCKQLVFNSTGGFYADYAVARGTLSVSNLFLLGRNLDELRQVLVGGYTSNPLIYVLSAVGAVFMLGFNNLFFDTLLLMLPAAAAPFLFADKTVQSRLLYTLPTSIYAAVGLHEALKLLEEKGLDKRVFATLTLLSLANYSFRSVANLV
ncbi:MAG: hypothetical protein QW334_00680 [Thermofilum sp.]